MNPEKEDKYRRIFCYEYNIDYKFPKRDTYATSDEYNILINSNENNEVKREELQIELELRQRRAEAKHRNLNNVFQMSTELSESIGVISFDL